MQQRLLIVTGKGGVGKSAMAAALAIQADRKGGLGPDNRDDSVNWSDITSR